jgi:UDP-N-acetylmuramyl-tripeptide synthetase
MVRPGEVFCAVSGTRIHGRDFIEAALRAGAVAVLVEDADGTTTPHPSSVPVIGVPQLKARMGEIAARFYGDPSQALRVIGVTGTNGKTTITHLIAQALSRIENTGPCGLIGTLGYGFPGRLQAAANTTPDPILLQQHLAELRDSGASAVAMEVSSHALDQSRTAGVRFAAAVFSNLTRDHLDYHSSMETYGAVKAGLFHVPGLGLAVINADDAFGRSLLRSLPPQLPTCAYTLCEAPDFMTAGRVYAGKVRMTRRGNTVDIHCADSHACIDTRLHGRFNAANLLAAFTTVVALGVQWEQAAAAFQDAGGVPGRMEPFQHGADSPLVIVDYAHTPDGLEQVLNSARELCGGRLWCLFGCGGNRDPGKRPLMGAIAAKLSDVVVVTSDNPRDEDPEEIIAAVIAGMPKGTAARVEVDRPSAIRMAIAQAASDDVVVVAGKGHEDYQEIRGKRLPLSDRAMVLAALRERS